MVKKSWTSVSMVCFQFYHLLSVFLAFCFPFILLPPSCSLGTVESQMEGEAPTASKAALPDLKKFLDKRVLVRLTGNRKVSGVLAGYDYFMNLVLHNTTEEKYDGSAKPMGSGAAPCVVRGNMVVNLELAQ